jgi:hypothetical protein
MKLSKPLAYLFFVGCIIAILICYQGMWLFSKTTEGEILNFGHDPRKRYRSIENVTVQYIVNNKIYIDTYLRNGLNGTAKKISIRYLSFAPSFSRLNTVIGNWGLVLVVLAISIPSLSIFFLIQDIVPNGTVFILTRSFPFIHAKKPVGPRDPNDQYAW